MKRPLILRPLAVAVAGAFGVPAAHANPTGAQIVNGAVTMQRPSASTLNVTNSPGAIINWQGFSIGAGEVTRFIQQSPASTVLNRVVGADISQISGQLLSNGRVFLINPAGIIIGGGAIVDTAGFVASTLNILDGDFLAGKLRFSGDGKSGAIVNQGWIRTSFGGNVVLVAPQIENAGLIQTPGGQLVLAAGQKLTIGSLEHEGVTFEVQAPTDSVLNVGKLLADGGAVGVFAGSLKHTGDIRANALVRDEGGRIILKAQGDVTLAGSSTISATGARGGAVQVLGNRVSLLDNASIDVSGRNGGGSILLGGDFQGANPNVQNAARTYVGAGSLLRADATEAGDGGRVVVWSDNGTRFFGGLSARGAGASGKGGFAEVSGKDALLFSGAADLGAPSGQLGTLLLDPLDTFVVNGGGLISQLVDEAKDFALSAITVSPATLAAVVGNVSLYASRYMRISDAINLTTAGQGLTAQVGAYTPPSGAPTGTFQNQLDIAAGITTAGGAVSLSAPLINSVTASTITTAGGAVTLSAAGPLQTSALAINAANGALPGGAVSATAGTTLNLGTVSGGSFFATSPQSLAIGGAITTSGGAVSLSNSAAFAQLSTRAIATNNGAVALTSQAGNVTTGGNAISAGSGNVGINAATGIFTGTIDTTAAVNLVTSAGSINAGVDNAASLNAAAVSSIDIGSSTALNANSITTSATNSSVRLTAAGNVNVGTVHASPTASGNNDLVSITSNTGSILPMSAASQITGTDVTLITGQLTDGGIGSAGTALNVDVRRAFSFSPNGAFNVLLNGSGPNRFTANIGVAKTAPYSGTITRSSGGINLTASADTATVTLNPPVFSGFDQRVNFSDPSITLRVPNGALVAATIVVPQGDTTVPTPPASTAGLAVDISASGNVNIGSFTRESSAQSLAKTTRIASDQGSVTLGTVNASKDTVTVNAGTDVNSSTINAAGNVSVTATNGNITVGRIDTTSGTGNVTLSAANGTVAALNDSVALEVAAGGSVSVTGQTIGAQSFGNPLDVAGSSITLTSRNTGGLIGTAANPVIANTTNLTINAASTFVNNTGGAQFNVSTGPVALNSLTVAANPRAIGNGGFARVRNEAGQPGDRTYAFMSDGNDLTFAAGTVPATQFAAGTLSLTTSAGNIVLGDSNVRTGALSVTSRTGSITGNGALDGDAITLAAGTASGSAVTVSTGTIGATVAPNTVSVKSGVTNSTTGSINIAGNIRASAVTLETYRGNISVNGGAGTIGNAANRGAITITTTNTTGSAGDVTAGDIIGTSAKFTSLARPINVGAIDVTGALTVASSNAFSSGAIDAASISVGDACFLCGATALTVNGAIGTLRPFTTAVVRFTQATINGSVTGANKSSLDMQPGLFNLAQPLVITGPVTAGADSSILLVSQTTYDFTRIDASSTGTVTLRANGAIRQTADGAADGIRAGTIEVSPGGANSTTNTIDPAGRMDLLDVASLTTNSSTPRFDVHGSTLTNLNVTKSTTLTAGAFELANLNPAQTISMTPSGNDAVVTVNSPTPLNFKLDYSPGAVALAGAGLVTSGGFAEVNAGTTFDGTAGGIHTSGGAVTVTGTDIITGRIDTVGTSTGAQITIGRNFGPGTLNLSDSLTAGTGAIVLHGSAVSGMAGRIVQSGNFVSITSDNGDIGSAGVPIAVMSPAVTLSARMAGRAFATLTGTSTLDLRGDQGFNVTSDTAFTTLAVATLGSGSGAPGGTLDLTAPGQTYGFARPTLDAFANTIASTFQVVNGGGTAAPPNVATFNALDGDLLVTGGAVLASPQLNLGTAGTGDVKLQGTATTPLVLNNAKQNIRSPRDLYLTGSVSLSSPDQTIRGERDVIGLGNLALVSSGTQNVSASRNVTVQANGGTVAITAPTQSISTTTGSMTFTGGNAADEALTIAGSASQHIFTPSNQGGDFILNGGAGDRASATVVYTGPNTGTQQTIEVRGNIGVRGGGGNASTALITTATGDQIVRAGVRSGEPFGVANGNIDVTGGRGTGATAGITNTGGALQQIGESHQRCDNSGCVDFDYQTRSITVSGNGDNASAQIVSAGNQHFYTRGGTLTVAGGSGVNATARIESTSALDQNIGLTPFETGNRMGSVIVQGGGGAGASALITTPAFQRVTMNNAFSLAGGPTGPNASAAVQGAGQDIRAGSISMAGGAADDNFTRLTSSAGQTITSGPITLTGGGTGAAGSQFNNAGVSIDGQSQTINAGAIAITGGAGRDATNVTDTLIRNTSGAQNLTASSIAITSGNQFGTAGIRNETTGTTQTVTTGGGITLSSTATGQDAAFARIENQPATQQKIETPFLDVLTAAGSAAGTSSVVSSAGTQWIHTSNGGMQVAALGSGAASVTAGTTQLLEIDYPILMQTAGRNGMLDVGRVNRRVASANAAGNSLVQATDQYIYAGGIFIRGPSNAAATSKISATATQNVSTVRSGLQLEGGAGANSLATLDPTDQTAVVTGPFNLTGGSNNNANSVIASQGVQQLVSTTDPINLTGGTAPGASALIITSAPTAFIVAANGVSMTPGTAPDADALMLTGNGVTLGGFTVVCNSCATPTLFSSNPQGNGQADAGAFGSWNSIPPSSLSSPPSSPGSSAGSSGLLASLVSDRQTQNTLALGGAQDDSLEDAELQIDVEDPRRRLRGRLCTGTD